MSTKTDEEIWMAYAIAIPGGYSKFDTYAATFADSMLQEHRKRFPAPAKERPYPNKTHTFNPDLVREAVKTGHSGHFGFDVSQTPEGYAWWHEQFQIGLTSTPGQPGIMNANLTDAARRSLEGYLSQYEINQAEGEFN